MGLLDAPVRVPAPLALLPPAPAAPLPLGEALLAADLIHSIAAWRALIQLIHKPFYWEKTPHGLKQGAGEQASIGEVLEAGAIAGRTAVPG